MRAHYLRSYLPAGLAVSASAKWSLRVPRGHDTNGQAHTRTRTRTQTERRAHTHTYAPTIAIRRGAKCGVGVATAAGVAAATANPLTARSARSARLPHNDIIIISGCRFTLSSAHRRESIPASLAPA